jgi:sulfate permease, SulP family
MPAKLLNHQFSFRSMMPDFFAGFISLLMTIIASLSYSTLIFSGELNTYLGLGIYSALISATVIGIVMSVLSSSRFTIAGPDANISALLALIVFSVASQLDSKAAPGTLFSTIWVILCLSSLITGIFLYAAGLFRLGRWIRFIPYPVIGGFLAGTGWLLIRGSFKVMADLTLAPHTLAPFLEHHHLVHWVPGLTLALIFVGVLRYYKHYLVLPSMLVCVILLSHLWFYLSGITIAQAYAEGFLLSRLPDDFVVAVWSSMSLHLVDWHSLGTQAGNLAALMIVAAIVILLNAASVEISTNSDVEVDTELKSTGLGNLMASPFGGLVGCMALSRTLLNWRAGAVSRMSGLICALLCAAALLLGASYLSYVPRFVLGALLLYLGLSLVVEWICDGWSRFSRFDYILVVIIFFIIAARGFLPGVGIGIIAACLLFAFNYSRINVVRHEISGARYRSTIDRSLQENRILDAKADQIYILVLQGFIFFGTAYPLLAHVQDRIRSVPTRFLLFDFNYISGMDSSAVLIFSKMRQIATAAKVDLLFVNLQQKTRTLLQEGGCTILQDVEDIPENQNSCFLFQDLDYAIGWCEEQLLLTEKFQDGYDPFEVLFSDVFHEGQTISDLKKYLERVEIPASAVLFTQGETSRDLYFIESGRIAVTLDLDDGTRRRLRSMSAGTIIGEMSFYLGTPRSGTIVAERPCVLHKLSAKALNRIESENRELAFAIHKFIVHVLAERLAHANERLLHLSG